MNEQERAFKGIWIPKEIWLDKRLSCFEKMIYAEIDSLCGEEGCFASNRYLAEFFGCTERHIRRALAHLKELGYIKNSYFDGRKRVISIEKNADVHPDENVPAGRTKMSPRAGRKCPPRNSYNKAYNKAYNLSSSDDDDKNNVVVVEEGNPLKESLYGCLFTEEQEEKILDKLSLEEVDRYCKKLSDWKKKNPGKTCRSDYRIIMQWAKEDRQTEDDYLDRLKINTEEIKSAAAGCDYKNPDDFYDAGAAISAAEGWNAAIDEIKKSRQKEDK